MGGLTAAEIRRRQSLGGQDRRREEALMFGGPSMAEAARARRAYRPSFEVAHGGDPPAYADLPQRFGPWACAAPARAADRGPRDGD